MLRLRQAAFSFCAQVLDAFVDFLALVEDASCVVGRAKFYRISIPSQFNLGVVCVVTHHNRRCPARHRRMELERLLHSSVAAAAAAAAAGRGCWPAGRGRTGRSRRSGFRTMPVSAAMSARVLRVILTLILITRFNHLIQLDNMR